jgi:hypothetical protein
MVFDFLAIAEPGNMRAILICSKPNLSDSRLLFRIPAMAYPHC